MALDTNYTSSTYNSFFDEAEMDSFVSAQIPVFGKDHGWSALTLPEKEAYILSSVRWVNRQKWLGTKNIDIVVPQMDWPRAGLVYNDGTAVPDTSTPDEIGLAQGCYILMLLSTGGVANVAVGAVKKKTVGSVSIEYETGSQPAATTEEANIDDCISKNVPAEWVTGAPSGGIGSIGLQRFP